MGLDIFVVYKDGHNLIYRLDPRAKLLFSIAFLVFTVSTPVDEIESFGCYLALILTIILTARISPFHVLRRSVIILPFVLAIAGLSVFFTEGTIFREIDLFLFKLRLTHEGMGILLNVLVKSWLSVIVLTTMMMTTRFEDILKGMELLKVPKIMVVMLSFTYRYVFVLIDQAALLMQARNMRYFGGGSLLNQVPVLGHMAGTLFIRTYEQAERIYLAMSVRGFTGRMRSLNALEFSYTDFFFLMTTLALLALVRFHGFMLWW